MKDRESVTKRREGYLLEEEEEEEDLCLKGHSCVREGEKGFLPFSPLPLSVRTVLLFILY